MPTPPARARLDRSAVGALIAGIAAASLACVPLLGAVLGSGAVWLALKSRSRRRAAAGHLHGSGLATAGLIVGGFGLGLGLIVTVLVAVRVQAHRSELRRPVAVETHDRTARFGSGARGFVFAKSGDTWGALWTNTRRIDTGQLDIELYCREEIYLTLLDEALVPKLKEQPKIIERPCRLDRKYNLLAIDGGFAVTYVEGEELRLARFDLASGRLTHDGSLLAAGGGGVLTNDSFGNTLATFRQDDQILIGVEAGGVVKTLGARPGQPATELLRVELPVSTYKPSFSGAFGRPSLFAWSQALPGELHHRDIAYALSVSGDRIDKTGTIRRVTGYSVDLAVLRGTKELSVFINADGHLWRQRFAPDGERLGDPELLVREAQGVYNFNAAETDLGCLLLFTAGNFDLKSYSCRAKKVDSLGDYFSVSLGCAGAQCLYSTSTTVRWLDPARPAPPPN